MLTNFKSHLYQFGLRCVESTLITAQEVHGMNTQKLRCRDTTDGRGMKECDQTLSENLSSFPRFTDNTENKQKQMVGLS